MIHETRSNSFAGPMVTVLTLLALLVATAVSVAKAQTPTARNNAHVATTQSPLYTEYRGVRIGMKAQDVRTKLGEPLQKADDMDFYAFSEKETAQIAYDASLAVRTISVDYLGGVGAPDYKLVVGTDVEMKPDGAIYKVVRYDSLGVWVYYNRTGGETPIVTITLQKSLQSH